MASGGGIYLNTDSGLADALGPDAQLKRAQLAQINAFSDGLPTDANGNIDWTAAGKIAARSGALDQAVKLFDVGFQQNALSAATKNAGNVGQFNPDGAAATDASNAPSSPSPSSSKALPANTNYYRGDLNKAPADGSPSPTQLFGYLTSQGASPKEALMLTSSAASESQFNPNAPHDGGIGYGLFGHNGDRLAAMRQQYGQTPTWQQQASFGLQELRSRPESALVNDAKSPEDLTIAQMHFERPQGYTPNNPQGGLNYDGRLATTRRFSGLMGAQPAQTNAQGQAIDPTTGQPMQMAQNNVSDDGAPPSSTHPFGAAPANPMPSSAASPQGQPAPSPQGRPVQLAQNGQPSSLPGNIQNPVGPIPQRPTQAPAPSISNAAPNPLDPTYGGLVPDAWLKAGGNAGGWVRYALQQSALNGALPGGVGKANAENWAALAKGLASAIDKSQTFTPEQKNARDPRAIQYEQDRADYNNQSRINADNSAAAIRGAGQRAQAEADVRAGTASQIAEQEGTGKYLGGLPAQFATAANNAKLQNNLLDQMYNASEQFRMGPGTTTLQNFYAKVLPLADYFGVDASGLKSQVAGYQDFAKIAGQIARGAIKETGSNRAGIQELQFVTGVMPSAEMSPDGFRAVINQMGGVNDYSIAKQQTAQDWASRQGTLAGFETAWNKNISPTAFVMHRLQTDQPEVFASTVKQLSATPKGREILKNVKAGLAWGNQAGVF